MTKLRKPHSIEFVLSQLLTKVTDDELKLSTNKSLSHFRKCSAPDDKDHTLYLKDAILLDLILHKKTLGTPLLNHFNLSLDYGLQNINEYENISNVLNNIGGRIGNLMDITQEAINPEGHEGSTITDQEKQKIFKAIIEVEQKIAKLKLSIK